VSFCFVGDGDGLDVEGLVLEELLDEGGGGAEGVVCACAAPVRSTARLTASALLVRSFTDFS
jgi:hypothetical protein